MMFKKTIGTLLILMVSAGAVWAGRYYWGPHGTVTMSRTLTSKSKGDPASPVWVVEFIDLQCSACHLAGEWLKEYMGEHPGRLYLQTYFHPIDKHVHGLESAVYGECASRQGRFWEFTDTVFGRQEEWAKLPEISERFHAYAASAGLNTDKLDACVRDPQVARMIMDKRREHEKTGIQATPSFLINGTLVVGLRDMLATFDRLDGQAEGSYLAEAQKKESVTLGKN